MKKIIFLLIMIVLTASVLYGVEINNSHASTMTEIAPSVDETRILETSKFINFKNSITDLVPANISNKSYWFQRFTCWLSGGTWFDPQQYGTLPTCMYGYVTTQ